MTITITSTKTIAEDTTIDGGGRITISGGGAVGILANNSSLDLRNLTIADGFLLGSADSGGGIVNSEGGRTRVTNCTLRGNLAFAGGAIANFGMLTISNSAFADNEAAAGAAINNFGSLTVTDSTFTANSGQSGGGIYNAGTLSVNNSTFASNGGGSSNPGSGGGIHNAGGHVAVTNSTFQSNSARSGGAILNANYGTLIVSNSTFSGNSVNAEGGGIALINGTAAVTNSTFSGNGASRGGGMVIGSGVVGSSGGELTLIDSVIANSTGGDCVKHIAATLHDGGHNLIEDAANSCGLTNGANGNIIGVAPKLDPAGLKDNGGPTQTIALLPGSPGRPPSTVMSALAVWRSTALLCAVVPVASARSPAQAGVNVWTSHGPEGGDVRALAIYPVMPSMLYAAGSSVFAIAQISACVAGCFDGNECVR
jgi:hypothetical protein